MTARRRPGPAARASSPAGDSEKLVYCADADGRRRARAGSATSRPWSTAGPPRRHALGERGPARPRRTPADGRGRRHRAHPVPHRRARRRAAARGGAVLRRATPGRRRFVGDGRFPWCPDHRAHAGREPRRSATSCSCATRCPTASRRVDPRWRPDDDSSCPPPTSGTRCPCRSGGADGFATVATAYTFDGLVDGREHLALGLAATRPRSPTPEIRPGAAAQRVPDRRRARQPALRLRTTAARVDRAARPRPAATCCTSGRRAGASGSTTSSTRTALQDTGLDTYQANVALGHGRRRARLRRRGPDAPRTRHRAAVRCSATTPTRPPSSTAAGLTDRRAGPDRRTPLAGERRLPRRQGRHGAHDLEVG